MSDTEDIQRESQPDAQCSAHTKQKMTFGPPARSCHLTKWPEFQGYGFTLHHNKVLGLQEIGERRETLEIVFIFFLFIGKVDEKSPAAAAGLKAQDIIIEINGINVTRENHKQIVERIKSSGDSTTFLVVDEGCKVNVSIRF